MKKVVFFFFSWLFSQGIGAQPLDSLLKIVEKENLSLLSRSALLSASKERVTQEGVLENPTLSFSAGRNMLLMGGRQMLPWWGTLNAMKEVARAETFIVQSEYNMLKNELLYEVKKSYFELAKLFQDILRIQSNIALLKKLETVVVEQYRTGKTSMADLIRLQMQIKE
ncbi:MAG: TolC family protein, partial [Flammeovirgaceae bacterium]|nr:TolC family protein [Flammeovirgaceae bacterium]MDW8288306.1 TolC family protein [Flammeovirgaceae bacterium]